MAFLYYFVIFLHVVACIFLIAVVLLQQGKGQDLASAFGGGGTQTAFGPRGSATVLSRATTILAGLFMVTSLALTIIRPSRSGVLDAVPATVATPTGRRLGPVTVPAARGARRGPGHGARSRRDPRGEVTLSPSGLEPVASRRRRGRGGRRGRGRRQRRGRQRLHDLERLADLERATRDVVPDGHHDLVVAGRHVGELEAERPHDLAE